MLNQAPDKLAHNASGQSELQEARHPIPEFTMVDKLSQSSIRGDPIYKGDRWTERQKPDSQRWGNARSKEQSDSRQPTLQEAIIWA